MKNPASVMLSVFLCDATTQVLIRFESEIHGRDHTPERVKTRASKENPAIASGGSGKGDPQYEFRPSLDLPEDPTKCQSSSTESGTLSRVRYAFMTNCFRITPTFSMPKVVH